MDRREYKQMMEQIRPAPELMERVLADAKSAGYARIMLWVFDRNVPAIRFYEAHGFAASGRKQPAFGAVEEMYIREL